MSEKLNMNTGDVESGGSGELEIEFKDVDNKEEKFEVAAGEIGDMFSKEKGSEISQ